MTDGRGRSAVAVTVLAMLVAACSSVGSTPTPPVTPAPTPTAQATAAPTPEPTPVTTPAGPPPDQQPPVAPTAFTAVRESDSVPCPSADGSCSQTDLAWQSTAAAGTSFRIYEASYGLDPNGTCAAVQGDAKAVLDTKPDVTTAQLFEAMAVGGGAPCFWMTAVNQAGESSQVPAAGQ